MATGFRSWSSTAATNSSADSNINWAEGQAPSSVNDSARYMMKVLADFFAAIGNGTISNATVGGTASAITLTGVAGTTTTARAAGQRYMFAFGSAVTGATTLAVDGLTSGAIQYRAGALISGDYASGEIVLVEDDATNYQVIGPAPRLSAGATDWATDATGGDVADLLVFADASQSNAINKVTVQKFYDVSMAALTAKATPVPADYLTIADSAASNVGKTATLTNVFQAIIGLTAKATPVVGDTLLISDSAASNAAKRSTITQFLTAVAAAQSDQETATSVVLPVTPGRQQFHPSACKAWALIDVAGTPGTLLASYNTTSVARNSAGNYTVTIATDMSSVNYAALVTVNASGGTPRIYTTESLAAGTFNIMVYTIGGANTDSGVTSISFACFGDQ